MLSWLIRMFFGPEPAPSVPMQTRPADSNRRIVRVSIDPGCLLCDACHVTCPKVFSVVDYSSSVIPGAERLFDALRDEIEQAAEGCCVEVIRIEYEAPPGPK
jgi:hypothetical protein